jgi:hypothetical protein
LTVSGTHFSPTGIHPPKLSMLGILTKKSSQPSRRPLVQWPCLGHGIQLGRTASQIVVLLTSKSNMSTNRLKTIFFCQFCNHPTSCDNILFLPTLCAISDVFLWKVTITNSVSL